jgi:hypothetical protein
VPGTDPSVTKACRPRAFGVALLLAVAAAAPARAQDHFDVLFYAQDGRVATGATDFGPPFQLLADVRVFPVIFDIATCSGTTSSPGFTASATPPGDGMPLPSLTPIQFRAEPVALLGDRFVSYWDGVGDVAFVEPPHGERIEIDPNASICPFCASLFISSDTAPTPTFPLGTTTDTATLHEHHGFKVRIGVGADDCPPDGVYLLGLRASVEGLAESEPFYAVFGQRVSNAELASAADWVEAHLLVPEPGLASALAACAALALLRARQRT